MSDSRSGGTEAAGRRAARNTGARGAAELVGKFSTLILFAAIGRALGQGDLGVLTFAFAYAGIAMTPVGFGTDPYLVRQVARSPAEVERLFWDVLVFKLAVAGPVLAVAIALLGPLGYDGETRLVLALLALMLLLDLLAKTYHSVFTGLERGELLAGTIIAQRLFTAGVGVAILAAGAGLVAVAAVFAAGAAVHLGLAVLWLPRAIEVPPLRLNPRAWWDLTRLSSPFAVQDVLTVLIFRVDAVLLSLLTVDAAVGRYGAAYRLVEATMFVGFALNGAFAAMYVYLTRTSEPTLGGAYGRSLKVGLMLLAPVAVAMATVPGELLALVYGEGFREGSETLRLLAPVTVLLVVVAMSTSLVVSRRSPRRVLPFTAAAVVVNLGLNLALIPPLEERGAALAMLVTELLLAAVVVGLVLRETGRLPWVTLVSGALVASAASVVPLLLLRDWIGLALPAAALTYLAVLTLVERRVAPDDLRFAVGLVRRRVAR